VAWLPTLLLLWLGWTVNRPVSDSPGSYVTLVFVGLEAIPEPPVARDHLRYEPHDGVGEWSGPSWGLLLGVTLILAVSLWATARIVRGAVAGRAASRAATPVTPDVGKRSTVAVAGVVVAVAVWAMWGLFR
jgi:hypothetical protein